MLFESFTSISQPPLPISKLLGIANMLTCDLISEPGWVKKARERRHSQSHNSTDSKACQCHSMFTTIYPQIIRHYKAAGTNHRYLQWCFVEFTSVKSFKVNYFWWNFDLISRLFWANKMWLDFSVFEALCSAGALGMALSFTFEAITYLEDALLLFKTRTKLNDTHR